MEDFGLALLVGALGVCALGLFMAIHICKRANPNDWDRHKTERGGFWANFWGRSLAEHDPAANFALCVRTGEVKRYTRRLTDDDIDNMTD